jgi:Transposase DDE domain
MSSQYRTPATDEQVSQEQSQRLTHQLERFLEPLLVLLDAYIDKRLVRTFVRAIAAILTFRTQAQGLCLSELGAYITNPAQAPAGTKRVSNLLRCTKWGKELIDRYIWEQADKRRKELNIAGEEALCIWDGSVIEKPESEKGEGLCAVKSSKAARLKKPRKGAFNKPGGKAVVVMGIEWLGVILVGMRGIPTVVQMKWWTRVGMKASKQRDQEEMLMMRIARYWGKKVIHVFDRGYAGAPWLIILQRYGVNFVTRWKKGLSFVDEDGNERKLGDIVRYKRSWGYKMIWDAGKHCNRKTGVFAMRVKHAAYAGQLWVVVVRQGGEPWYLITNRCADTQDQAWHIVLIYARRWQIETTFRYKKSELAVQSVRLWEWENREKLFLLVTLAYSFLLSLLDSSLDLVREWLLRHYCHRTGKKYREAKVPLYRIRWALSRLWSDFRPVFSFSVFEAVPISGNQDTYACSKNSG